MKAATSNIFGEVEKSRIGFAHDIDRENGKEEWLTPQFIINALGNFDLDPCAPIKRPWPTAKKHFTVEDNGLIKPWEGFVFCNPPYGPKTGDWLSRCAEHDNCIALVFARTETAAFHQHVWPKAKSLFFIKGRISFCHVSGKTGGGFWRTFRVDCLWRPGRPALARTGKVGRLVCGEQKIPKRIRPERIHWRMIRALYVQGKDGKYRFVAAFANDGDLWDGDVADTYAENLEQEGHTVLAVNNCALNKLPDVWSGQ